MRYLVVKLGVIVGPLAEVEDEEAMVMLRLRTRLREAVAPGHGESTFKKAATSSMSFL